MRKKKSSGMTLFVEFGPEQSKYLCASVAREKSGSVQLSVSGFGQSATGRSIEELVAQLATEKIRPRQVVLLLPRSDFEVNSFQLPEVDEADTPQLVTNLVSESMDSMDFTTDYLLNSRSDSEGKNALTWTLANDVLNDFRNEAKQSGLTLAGVTSHAIGSVSLWRNLVKSKSPHAVIVTIASQLIDFSVIYNHEVTHIRTIPFSADDVEQISRRLIGELQRTVVMTGESEGNEATRVYLFGSPEHQKPIAEALTEEFDVPVSILNPVDRTKFTNGSMSADGSEEYAHLIGAAKAYFFDRLEVDLISPRRPQSKSLPWRRIAIWAFLVVSLLGIGGFVVWDDAVRQNEEIAERRKEFDELATEARRVLEMKDELAAIRAWRASEVVWLDELDQLSRDLPPREQSLIRRISMNVDDNGQTRIDLAVEVSDSSLVAQLENSIRSEKNRVNSKRVSESSGREGAKWNFETSIRFDAQSPMLSFLDPESQDSQGDNNVPNTDNSTTGSNPPPMNPADVPKPGDDVSKGDAGQPATVKPGNGEVK